MPSPENLLELKVMLVPSRAGTLRSSFLVRRSHTSLFRMISDPPGWKHPPAPAPDSWSNVCSGAGTRGSHNVAPHKISSPDGLKHADAVPRTNSPPAAPDAAFAAVAALPDPAAAAAAASSKVESSTLVLVSYRHACRGELLTATPTICEAVGLKRPRVSPFQVNRGPVSQPSARQSRTSLLLLLSSSWSPGVPPCQGDACGMQHSRQQQRRHWGVGCTEQAAQPCCNEYAIRGHPGAEVCQCPLLQYAASKLHLLAMTNSERQKQRGVYVVHNFTSEHCTQAMAGAAGPTVH
eukprot:GHUV01055657.1.p1 GENE.GHUV01055657.1~~GHUV01055657.1.p1  ORF type:complete len:293 (-),score=16.69 GHUV01055657.1:266-1144(-)